MANSETLIPIPGRLHSVATEGHVAGADEIFDDTQNKLQSALNSDAVSHIGNGDVHVTTSNKSAWNAKYDKPATGIPSTDMSEAVQTSLGKADTAIQDISGKADKTATVSTVTYDSSNKKITKTINGTTTDVTTAAQIAADGGAVILTPVDLDEITPGYQFKVNDAVCVDGIIFRCTSATDKPPYDFVFDANNSIVMDFLNGQNAYVVDGNTLNPGWEKYADISDRHYVATVKQELLDAIALKANITTTVTNVSFASGKIQKTINGTTTDVVGAATTSANGLMSSEDKTKLDSVATGAEVNVQSDWNQSDNTKDDYIKNKPTLITYSFEGGTNKITVTPSSGTAQDVTITPSIDNNVTANGNFAANAIVVGNAASKVAKNSGVTISSTTPSAESGDTTVPTSKAVWAAVSNGIATADAMVYKGTVAGGSTGNYGALTPAGNKGETYKVTTAGKIDGVAVEVGDMIICNTDETAAATSSNYSTIAAKWDFIQANIDGAVTGPSTSTDAHVAVFNGTTGKVIKDSGYTIAKSVPSDAKFTDNNTTYKFTIGTTTKGDSTNGVDLGTLKSETAASGGTTLSLVTTGEKNTWNNKGTYSKPSGGIPKSDLASAVQTSLGLADTALQVHQDISGKADKSATVSTVAYDTTNKKLTKTINGTTTDVVTAAKIVTDGGGTIATLNFINLGDLAHDYSFKVNDALCIDGVIYKCTSATTKPPFNFVFDSNNSIVYDSINGQTAFVVDSNTFNTGWQAYCDMNDRHYVESAILRSETSTKARENTITNTITVVDKKTGIAYATCSTASNTAAKAVTVSNFILAEKAAVSVLFTNQFGTTNSTLNVSGTGAMPILYFGSAIAPGKVRANTILNMQYDGTNWNVLSIESFAGAPSTAVDLGLPSGLLWCDRNVGASAPWSQGDFFAWGDIEGHSATTSHLYNIENYEDCGAAFITSDLSLSYDGARQNLGSPWRMPTKAEFKELMDNCTIEEFEMNDADGLLFTSNINGNTIFLPEVGYIRTEIISGTEQNVHVPGCHIWTSTMVDMTYAWSTYKYSSGQSLILTDEAYRHMARQIRPVM